MWGDEDDAKRVRNLFCEIMVDFEKKSFSSSDLFDQAYCLSNYARMQGFLDLMDLKTNRMIEGLCKKASLKIETEISMEKATRRMKDLDI